MSTIPASVSAEWTNMVHAVEVQIGSKTLTARYYVEDEIIVAIIGDKKYRCPVGSVPASETVRAILTEVAMANLV